MADYAAMNGIVDNIDENKNIATESGSKSFYISINEYFLYVMIGLLVVNMICMVYYWCDAREEEEKRVVFE